MLDKKYLNFKIMRLLREFNKETEKLLMRIYKQSKFSQVRERAKSILLTYQGFTENELIKIFQVSRKTLYNWWNRWEKKGIIGLYNVKGRGRKQKLNQEQQLQVKEWVKSNPKNLNQTCIKVAETWGITLSKDTIKRIIKKQKMNWKRMKRGLSGKPDEWELEVKIPKLLELKEKEKKGEIELRYFDESGISLTPSIPYGWQEINSNIILKSSQSKRLNILGLLTRNNELYYEIFGENINSEIVIKFFDKFSDNLSKTTVIILDQASIHTSDAIIKKLEEWEAKNLYLFWLPTYSPKENLIEILWRFIKYEWIEISAYKSWKNLLNYLKKVMDNLGKEYVINFA